MATTDSVVAQSAAPGVRGQDLVRRDGEVYTPAMGRVYPFVMERGEGCYVWDIDGNRYLDLNAGIAVVAAGHSHPALVAAVQAQAAKFIHMAGTDFYSEPMVQFGEKLVASMPQHQRWQVFPCNSGTEAVEAAIKLARHSTGRQGILGFYGAFHGRSYGALSLTASKPAQRRGFGALVPGSQHTFFPNPYRPPFGVAPADVVRACLDHIEHTLFATVMPPEDVAAIIVEPIQGEGGYLVPPPGFLCGLRRLCDQHGILLIFDEVQSGVGRTGRMWAFEHECMDLPCRADGSCARCGAPQRGVIPDIVASAKGLGGGVPIGAMIARRELMERWPAGAHGNTYGGNALACAAACTVLDLVHGGLAENAARVGDRLKQGLEELQGRYEQIGEVRGRGLMVGVEFVYDRDAKKPAKALAEQVMQECFRRGALVLTCGASTVRFCPPLTLSESQADEGLTIFDDTLRALTRGR